MADSKRENLDALSNSRDYQNRFTYLSAPRSDTAASEVSIGELGHMLDTLKDGLLAMRQIAAKPRIDVKNVDHVYKHLDQKGLPPYVTALATQFLAGSSFHRTDEGRRTQAKSYPDLSAFMNELHGMMRGLTTQIGRQFVISEPARAAAEDYDRFIDEYRALLKAHKAEDGTLDNERIPPEAMAEYAKRFNPAADKLEAALKALPAAEIKLGDRIYSLPNDRLLNERLGKTFPAPLLFVYRSLGSGAADRNKRPGKLEYAARQRDLIGAQSMITDTMQGLYDLAASQGVPLQQHYDLNRPKVKEAAQRYARSLQLVLAFCQTADCGYEMMYKDLEHFIHMGDREAPLRRLETPYEAALMLYAVERRLARDKKLPNLQTILRVDADVVSVAPDLASANRFLSKDPKFRDAMSQLQVEAEKTMPTALPAIELLSALAHPGATRRWSR